MESDPPTESDITPKEAYFNRRELLRGLGIGLTSLAVGGIVSEVSHRGNPNPSITPATDSTPGSQAQELPKDEFGNQVTSPVHATGWTNYYDVSTDNMQIPKLAQHIQTSPWSVAVGGLVNKPETFSIEQLLSKFSTRQRIYRMRCVEAWGAVIPWDGFVLNELLDHVEPTAEAKWVRFESKFDPTQFLGQQDKTYPWPYLEALRLDEAMNPLTMMVTGMYGQPLAKQSGAPIRLVVPWKYGFKSAKAVVKIDLVAERPVTFWNIADPESYGFYGNVNPNVTHPKWSQTSELRLGTGKERFKTLMFNGYEQYVAHMYKGMDLVENY